jgi:hypothetical protein
MTGALHRAPRSIHSQLPARSVLKIRMGLKLRKNRSAPPPERCAGPPRFSELRADIPAVSAKVLSQRLRKLEGRGVVRRTIQYALTPMGAQLVPALE